VINIENRNTYINTGANDNTNEIYLNGNIKTAESCELKLDISFNMGNINEKVNK
jgi:hypothetical protein